MLITHNNFMLTNNGIIIGELNYNVVPTPPPIPSTLRIHVIGDNNVSLVSTNLSSEIIALGYNTPTITTQIIGTTYTGSDINTETYDVVIYWTNASQTGSVSLTNNLINYVNSGGNLVTGTFIWNIRPTGFDYSLTPYNGPVNQSNNSSGNMTIIVPHPITDNLNTNITNNSTILNNLVTTLTSGSTTIATYTLGGTPYVGINTIGTSRLVGINCYFASGMGSRANLRRLVTNCVLWSAKIIN
jgi:hypothetical protein